MIRQSSCLVAAALIALTGCTSPPVPRPTSAVETVTGRCTEFVLREASDDAGSRPLLAPDDNSPGQYWFDSFVAHFCVDGWALVETTHSSGSVFNFWLLRSQADSWTVLAQGGVRLDTDPEQAVFAATALPPDVQADEVIAAFGSSTTPLGRPLFDS